MRLLLCGPDLPGALFTWYQTVLAEDEATVWGTAFLTLL